MGHVFRVLAWDHWSQAFANVSRLHSCSCPHGRNNSNKASMRKVGRFHAHSTAQSPGPMLVDCQSRARTTADLGQYSSGTPFNQPFRTYYHAATRRAYHFSQLIAVGASGYGRPNLQSPGQSLEEFVMSNFVISQFAIVQLQSLDAVKITSQLYSEIKFMSDPKCHSPVSHMMIF